MLDPHLRGAVLSVPASRPERFETAVRSGADAVILDLEDAVASAEKRSARRHVTRWLREDAQPGPDVIVRVNELGSRWFRDDVGALLALPPGRVTAIMLPKTETGEDVRALTALIDATPAGQPAPGIYALIETAAGIENLREISGSSPRLLGLATGFADLAASLGSRGRRTSTSWLPVRERVLISARAAGIAAIDGPILGTGVGADLTLAAAEAAELGYLAKWVIHPAQIEAVHAALRPTVEELEAAREVLRALADAESEGQGALKRGGQMIDAAVAAAARRLLESDRGARS